MVGSQSQMKTQHRGKTSSGIRCHLLSWQQKSLRKLIQNQIQSCHSRSVNVLKCDFEFRVTLLRKDHYTLTLQEANTLTTCLCNNLHNGKFRLSYEGSKFMLIFFFKKYTQDQKNIYGSYMCNCNICQPPQFTQCYKCF